MNYRDYSGRKNSKITTNSQNLGFARAVNQGIKELLKTNVQKILLVNPDLEMNQRVIVRLLKSTTDISSPILNFKRYCQVISDFGG